MARDRGAAMTTPHIPVIDWTTVRKGGTVRILPTEWVKIIMHLQYLNTFRKRAHDV